MKISNKKVALQQTSDNSEEAPDGFVDSFEIEIKDMHLYSMKGEYNIAANDQNASKKNVKEKVLQDCSMKLTWDRKLDTDRTDIPDTKVLGYVSGVDVVVNTRPTKVFYRIITLFPRPPNHSMTSLWGFSARTLGAKQISSLRVI